MHRFIPFLALFISTSLFAQSTPSFTYQGYFLDDGVPAQGNYDIFVRVYDQELGGTALAGTLVLDAEIVDGLFSISVPTEVPPGTPVFSGADRWIEVALRDGDKSIFDPLTFLPRQLAQYAPLAAHATRAEHALVADELASPIWSYDGFLNEIVAGDTNTGLLINTAAGFGNTRTVFHRDTNGVNPVAISTSGVSGKPILSFVSGFEAFMGISGKMLNFEFDGATGIFRVSDLSNTTTARLVPNTGLEILQGGVLANDFEYINPQSRRMSIPPAAWIPAKDVSYTLADQGNGLRSYIDQFVSPAERMFAPVSLPDGATIQSVKFYYSVVGSGTTMGVRLYRGSNSGSSLVSVCLGVFMGGNSVSPTTISANPSYALVDNGTFNYYLEALSGDWDSFGSVSLGPVVITYTVDEPD